MPKVLSNQTKMHKKIRKGGKNTMTMYFRKKMPISLKQKD